MTVKMTSSDFGKVGHALGIVSGIAQEFDTGVYSRDLVRAAGNYASGIIGENIDDQAKSNTSLGHVYEWRLPGTKSGRLFDIYSKGAGKTQVVTFTFRASKTPIPSLAERERDGKILPVPAKIKSRLKNRSYIFRQKAQFFEYGTQPANIAPTGPNKKIFIPFSQEINGRTYAFVDRATVNFENTRYRGQFSLAWKVAALDAGGRTSAWLEREVSQNAKETSMRMGKVSSKSLMVGFSSGQDYARNRMKLHGNLVNAKAQGESRI